MKQHPMSNLKEALQQVLNIVPPKSQIYYLDYPTHSNIGDLLILQGTEKFFKDYRIRVSERFNFPKKMEVPKEIIFVFHGGGNFGDMYPRHQRFREYIIQSYPHNRVVILPQTVNFTDKSQQNKSLALLSKHKDLHIFVRDHKSFHILSPYIKNTYLSPDMAHQLWPIKPNHPAVQKTLYLLRADIENKFNLNLKETCTIMDWRSILTKEDYRKIKQTRVIHHSANVNDSALRTWYQFKDQLIQRGIALFSSYDEIVTSRLHGHILACLMGKNNKLIDNSYGKNISYYQAWTQGIPGAALFDHSKIEQGGATDS